MLLPAGISFDSEYNESSSRYHHSHGNLLVSPPNSPPQSQTSHTTAISSIFSTCRALQSMLTASNQLPSPASSPPLLNTPAPLPAPKFRLRSRSSRKTDSNIDKPHPMIKMKVSKKPSRGVNKRRRSSEDDGQLNRIVGRADVAGERSGGEEDGSMLDCPSTPKRSRIAPETIPFGLTRSEFHDVHLQSMPARKTEQSTSTSSSSASPAFTFSYPYPQATAPAYGSQASSSSSSTLSSTFSSSATLSSAISFDDHLNVAKSKTNPATTDSEGEAENTTTDEEESWPIEKDMIMLELVLEKMKLSKSDWEDCAQSLGKDSGDVRRRWKSLMSGGEIGLKKSQGRGKLFDSWR